MAALISTHRAIRSIERQRLEIVTREEVVLGHLAVAGATLAWWQRGEGVGVADHPDRLPERPDEVLALGKVDAGLAADGGIDHRQQ